MKQRKHFQCESFVIFTRPSSRNMLASPRWFLDHLLKLTVIHRQWRNDLLSTTLMPPVPHRRRSGRTSETHFPRGDLICHWLGERGTENSLGNGEIVPGLSNPSFWHLRLAGGKSLLFLFVRPFFSKHTHYCSGANLYYPIYVHFPISPDTRQRPRRSTPPFVSLLALSTPCNGITSGLSCRFSEEYSSC